MTMDVDERSAAPASKPVERKRDERETWLVARAIGRDQRAFQELYGDYHARVTRFLMQLMKRPPLVEEVANDTMMAVWEGLHTFKGDSRLSTWVFSIAYRKGVKALARNDSPIDDKDRSERKSVAPDPEEFAATGQRRLALRQAIDTLSADHRAVVDLTYFHEMGYREIAAIMDCPVDTVKTRMFHARRQLKKALSGDRSDWL